ncbi:MAG: ParA family protein [Acidobacteriota bacterium]
MRVAMFNQSGGVGKTSLTRDLGYELAMRDQRVLVIDADPQGTLGSFLGMEPATRPREDTFWAAVCDGDETPPRLWLTNFELTIGLANRFLVGDELSLMQQSDPARLLAVVETHLADYDWVLFDCPPKISEVTLQILLAADALLAPVQTEAKSVESFAEVQLEVVKAQRRRKNMRLAPLRVLGVVPTLYNPRLVLHRHHYAELAERICPAFGFHVFGPIRDYIAVSEAGTRRQPLKRYAPQCPAAADVAALAANVLQMSSAHR